MTTHAITLDSAGGEYMEAVLVVSWAARPGDPVKAGQVVVTVETAKAATEVEATHDGWLAAIAFPEGQEAPVGAVLGTISDMPLSALERAAAGTHTPQPHPASSAPENAADFLASARIVASPYARRLAREANLDLASLPKSAKGGRIKGRDVEAALASTRPTAGASRAIARPPALEGRAPVVLLHGFAADRFVWRHVLTLLPREVETIALDLPGHGAEAWQSASDIEDIGLALSEQLERRGVEDAHVVGHSLGGAAAVALCSLGRISARSVTLLAPAGLGPQIDEAFLRGVVGATSETELERWLGFMVGDASVLPSGYARAALRQMEKTGNRETLARMAGALFPGGASAFDLRPMLDVLNVPTRLIWGRRDRVLPCAYAANAPGFAAVHLLEDVGHAPHVEAPALTARLISETIRSAS